MFYQSDPGTPNHSSLKRNQPQPLARDRREGNVSCLIPEVANLDIVLSRLAE